MTATPGDPALPATCGKWLVVLMLIGLAAYANAFKKGFVFDDIIWITTHPDIGDASEYIRRSGARPLVAATVVVNHRLGGTAPIGYHAFNVGVHIAAVLALFSLLARLFALPGMPERFKGRGVSLAFGIALLWAVHPLNSQAVAYVIQRAESMMGLFFILGFYCWLRGSESRPRLWLPLALACFCLSTMAKEVGIVWPILIAAFDRIFLAGSWKELLHRRWAAYAALGALWACLLLPVLAGSQSGQDSGVGFGLAISPMQYALTETEVVWHYFRLAFWPVGQSGDYSGWPLAKSLHDVWPAASGIAFLVVAMGVALWFRPKLGFPLLWCLIILAPTSTVMPILDVAYEHRMYLPLIGLIALAVIGTDALLASVRNGSNIGLVLLIVAGGLLAVQTVRRNEVYRNNATFFGDVLARRPDNLRALGAVADSKITEGKLDEAGRMLDALEAHPLYDGKYRIARARWHMGRGEPEKARAIYAAMVAEQSPFDPRLWATPYPRLLLASNDPAEAAAIALKITESAPKRADGFAMLAAAELASGHGEKLLAGWSWQRAIELDPKIGATIHTEARKALFNAEANAPLAASTETERLNEARSKSRAYYGELAYHLAKMVVAFDANGDPMRYDTLAAAASITGRKAEAVDVAKAGYDVAVKSGDTIWASALRDRLAKYRTGAAAGK